MAHLVRRPAELTALQFTRRNHIQHFALLLPEAPARPTLDDPLPTDLNQSPSSSTTMADQVQEILDVPREFLKDGIQFINKAQKRMSLLPFYMGLADC